MDGPVEMTMAKAAELRLAAPDSIADATPEIDDEDWDIDEWMSGVTRTVRAVKLYRRADLVAVQEDLEHRLRIAQAVPEEDRELNGESPEGLIEKLESVAKEFEASGRWWKVEGRSDEFRKETAERLKKFGKISDAELALHHLAEATIQPKGVTVDILRKLRDEQEAQYALLWQAYALASGAPPRVDVPFSGGGSDDRRRRASS